MSTTYKYRMFHPSQLLQNVVIRTTESEVPPEYVVQHLWLPDAAAADLVESMQRPVTSFCVGDMVNFRATPEIYTIIACSIDSRGVICCTTRSDLGWVKSSDLILHRRATANTIALAQAYVEHANHVVK